MAKRFCKHGHDTDIVGRNKSHACNECQNKRTKGPYSHYKKYFSDRHLQKKYGLSPAQYQQMVDASKGICQLCKKQVDKFHVDHDHVTGEVRGLLCKNCNWGLGQFSDDVETLKRAICYLEPCQ